MGAGRILYVGDELMGFDSDFRRNLRDQIAIVNPPTGTDGTDYFIGHGFTAKSIRTEKRFQSQLTIMKTSDSKITDLILSLGTFELYSEYFDVEPQANALSEFSEHYQAVIAMVAENFESLQRVILVIPPIMSAQADKKLIATRMIQMYRDVLTKEHPFQLVAVDLLNSMENLQTTVGYIMKLTYAASKFALRMVAEAMELPVERGYLHVVSGDQATGITAKRFVDLTLPEHEVDLKNLNPVDLFRARFILNPKPAVQPTGESAVTTESKSEKFASFKDAANSIMVLCGALGTIGAVMVGLTALAGLVALSATGIGLVAAGLVVSMGLFAGGLALLHKRHPEKYGFPQLCNSPGAAFNMPSGYFGPAGGMIL